MAAIRVVSVDDPRVDDFRVVSDPSLMRARRLFVAEGRLAVERLLRSRYGTRAVLVTDAARDRLAAALAATGGPAAPTVYLTDTAQLRRITGFRFHRGCLALGERLATTDPLPSGRIGRPIVVLEGVADPDNVGAIFRSAAAFGVSAVVLSPTTADPLYRKAIRTSMGTTLQIPFTVTDAWPEALDALRARGVRLVALTPDPTAPDLERLVARAGRAPLALVCGNEGDGVSAAARAACDEAVRIGMAPGVDSLNVATAAAIVLYRLRAPAATPG